MIAVSASNPFSSGSSGSSRLPARPHLLLLAAGSGALLGLPWLDDRLFPAVWIGMMALMVLAVGRPPYVAFRIWLIGGLAKLVVAFYWLPGVAADQLDVSLWTGILVGLLSITWDAFRFGIFGWGAARLPQTTAVRLLVWPMLWVALEWIWPHVFPWRIGHTQWRWLSVCQIAEITGVYGVSFLLVCGAAAAASLCFALHGWPERSQRRRVATGLCVFAGLGAVTIGWGAWRVASVERAHADGRTVRLAIVQPGSLENSTEPFRRLTRQLEGESDLVVWGESSVGTFSAELTSFRDLDSVRAASRFGDVDPRPFPGLGRPLLCCGGSFASGHRDTGPYRNTAYLIDADESIIGRYDKRVLMPWGEYAVGQQWIPGLRSTFTTADPREPGTSSTPLMLPGKARLGVLVCYDDMVPLLSRRTVQEGAEVLINLNNLADFRKSAALREHQMIAAFRTIETRRWLVRVGTVGSSAVIAASGRRVVQLPPHKPAVAVHDVPLASGLTIYTRYGDVFAAACTAGVVCYVAWLAVTRRRASCADK